LFARDWLEACNAHDVERIFSDYRDDFEMSSPLVAHYAR
jgi:ketosteroid isomerase-like protein